MISTYRKCYSNLLASAKMIRSSEADGDDVNILNIKNILKF